MITGILPCVKITSLNPDANMVTIVNSDILRLVGSPVKVKEKLWKRISGLMKGDYTIGLCVPRLPEKKSILWEVGKLGSKHPVIFSKGTWHHVKIRERKGPSQGVMQKCEPQERFPWGFKISKKERKTKP